MDLRHVVSAILLFAAAAGWSESPPPWASPAVAFHLPTTFVLLGLGLLLAGRHHRDEREKP